MLPRSFSFVLAAVAVSGGRNDVYAQPLAPPSPKCEVRAVWITTTSGLDWPHSTDPAEQQASLRAIVRSLRARNFNTIYFQVRARGDAYYRSHVEPWAENLTGTLGKDPGYDPLELLITEAHASGLEVHAWFNVFKIRGPHPVPPSVPPHPSLAFPRWVAEVDDELWMDPGVPQVREYLLAVALDLVRHYDLDGINFDFLRYPGSAFPDEGTYRRYGHGLPRDAWRRENIDAFVAAFHDSVILLNPLLKVGAAPLGVYRNGNNGRQTGSYAFYAQDSYGWIQKGLLDYLVPQLYWSRTPVNGSEPSFCSLLHIWSSLTAHRHVYIGIGAFKPEVAGEIAAQVDSVRASGFPGMAFFRLESISDSGILRGRFATPSLCPPMRWKTSGAPRAPSQLTVTGAGSGAYRIAWSPSAAPAAPDSVSQYVVYRSRSGKVRTDDPAEILAVLPGTKTTYIDASALQSLSSYTYAVTAMNRASMESVPSPTAKTPSREMLALKEEFGGIAALVIRQPLEKGPLLIGYTLPDTTPVLLEVLRQDGQHADSLIATPVRSTQNAGIYAVGLDSLAPGRYLIRLATHGTTVERELRVGEGRNR